LAQAAVVGALPFAVLDVVKAHVAALLVAPPRRGRPTA
jgi:biotin transporter BioY